MPEFLIKLASPVLVPAWQFLLLALGWFVAVALILRTQLSRGGGWNQWQAGDIFGLHWRWKWRGNEPTALKPYCPDDHTPVVYHYRSGHADTLYCCESCGRQYGPFAGDHGYVLGMIKRQIERRLVDGSWQRRDEPALQRPAAAAAPHARQVHGDPGSIESEPRIVARRDGPLATEDLKDLA